MAASQYESPLSIQRQRNLPTVQSVKASKPATPQVSPVESAPVVTQTSLSVNVDSNSTVNTRKDRNILFVHVGKAGGETIKNILEMGCKSRKNKRRREECMANVPHSALSNQVHGYFHCFTIEPKRFQPDTFLFNLRHPIDRAVSWYRYVHPGHCPANSGRRNGKPVCIAQRQLNNDPEGWVGQFFQQCFPTVQDWAMGSTARSSNCKTLASQTYDGTLSEKDVPLAAHMIANLQHYVEKTVKKNPNAEILVVRTNSLWQDLKDLDIWLGGKGTFGTSEGSAVTHGSENYNHHSPDLTEEATTQLCCALKSEIEWYRTLVQRAANLVDKKTELARSVERCGVKSWEELQEKCRKR